MQIWSFNLKPILRFKKNSTMIHFLICDKPNIYKLQRLRKFAFVKGKIVEQKFVQ